MKNIFRVFFSFFLFSQIFAPAFAQQNSITALGSVNSPELIAFAATAETATREDFRFGAEVLHLNGYLGEPYEVTRHSFRVRPLIYFDSNVNGGFRSDTIWFQGLAFEVDPMTIAVGGVVLGGEGAVMQAMNLALGTTLLSSGKLRATYAPSEDTERIGVQGMLCVKNMRSRADFISICGDLDVDHLKLGTSARAASSLAWEHLSAGDLGFHSFTTALRETQIGWDDAYRQTSIEFSTRSATTYGSALFTAFALGEAVEGHHAMRERIMLGIAGRYFGHNASFSIGFQTNRGGYFLGSERRERTATLSAAVEISQKLAIEANYQRVFSNVSFYEGDTVNVALNYAF